MKELKPQTEYARKTVGKVRMLIIDEKDAIFLTPTQFKVFTRMGFIYESKYTQNLYRIRNQYQGKYDEKTRELVIIRKSAAPITRGNPKLNCQTVWNGRVRNQDYIKANRARTVDHCEGWEDGLYGIDPKTL